MASAASADKHATIPSVAAQATFTTHVDITPSSIWPWRLWAGLVSAATKRNASAIEVRRLVDSAEGRT